MARHDESIMGKKLGRLRRTWMPTKSFRQLMTQEETMSKLFAWFSWIEPMDRSSLFFHLLWTAAPRTMGLMIYNGMAMTLKQNERITAVTSHSCDKPQMSQDTDVTTHIWTSVRYFGCSPKADDTWWRHVSQREQISAFIIEPAINNLRHGLRIEMQWVLSCQVVSWLKFNSGSWEIKAHSQWDVNYK